MFWFNSNTALKRWHALIPLFGQVGVLSPRGETWKLLVFWMPFAPITEAAGALQAAVNDCRRRNKDNLLIRFSNFLLTRPSRGFKANVLLASWRFLPRERYTAVTEDGQAFVIGAMVVLGPGRQTLLRRPMRLRPLNACWLPVALMV